MTDVDAARERPPVARLYANPAAAQQAITALRTAGISVDAISVVSRSTTQADEIERVTGVSDDLEEAAARRHPLSDFVGWLGRVESVVVPGFGGVLGSGNLWQDIAPAADSRGAITGALVGRGMDVDEAARIEQSVLDGELLLVVDGPGLETSPDQVQTILDAT